MKIVVLDGYVANPGDLSWEGLASQGELVLYDRTAADQIVVRAADADAIFVNKVVITADIIAQLPRLKFIGELATGYNNIDIAAAHAAGITVCNVPGYSGDSVAQLVFAFILAHCNKVTDYNASVWRGDWCRCLDFSYLLGPITELAGTTIGIYGLGNIGGKIAAIAHAFGMHVISSTSKPAEAIAPYVERVAFDDMLARADFLSINAPLSASNRGLFGAETLGKMKTTAMLINTARGPIVDSAALAEALRQGVIAAAAVDVLDVEPPTADNPLLAHDIADRLIITPHIAWESVAARQRLLAISASNLAAFIAGTPVNRVLP